MPFQLGVQLVVHLELLLADILPYTTPAQASEPRANNISVSISFLTVFADT